MKGVRILALWGLVVTTASCASFQSAKAPTPAASLQRPESAVLFPAINVRNLEAAEAFFVDLVGMKVTLRLGEPGEAHREVTLNFSGDIYADEASLVLNWVSSREKPYVFDGLSRLALRVPDVDALVDQLARAGHAVLDGPRSIEVDGAVIRLAFVEGPEGVRIELIERRAR